MMSSLSRRLFVHSLKEKYQYLLLQCQEDSHESLFSLQQPRRFQSLLYDYIKPSELNAALLTCLCL